jgi:asparagine synthase (glutamine-hydrolysing)
LSAVDYLKFSRLRAIMMEQLEKLMQTIDTYFGDELALCTNLAGHPGLAADGYPLCRPADLDKLRRGESVVGSGDRRARPHIAAACRARRTRLSATDMAIELMISDPGVQVLEGPAVVVVAHGELPYPARRILRDVAAGARDPEALQDVAKQADDALLLAAPLDEHRPQAVTAWRSATSNHELYVVRRPGRSLLLSDSFRAACASLPVKDRRMSERAIADHLLFRTVPGRHTYLAALTRLAHGERLDFDPVADTLKCSRFDTLDAAVDGDPSRAARLDAIEQALEMVIPHYADHRDTVNLLSGGVDSTLIQTFLPKGFRSVSTAIDTPEFAFEVQYAETASRLLGVEHEFVRVKEHDYVRMLEDAVRELALPPHHLQTVLIDAAFQSRHAGFITGQFADCLFGLRFSRTLSLADALRPLLRFAPWRVPKARKARQLARDLRLPLGSPDGPAMGFGVYSDIDLVGKMIGISAVHESLRARLDYVEAVCPFVRRDDSGLAAHLELFHLIDFFCADTASLWRQLAHARSKRLYVPFVARSIVQSAISIPAPDRYVHRFREKHLLKGVLARRLPSYRVHKRKGASGLPARRFLSSGPLRDLFNDYDMPDFVPRELAETIRHGTGWLSWNCLTFAVWRDAVLRDAALAPPINTRTVRLA